MKVIQWYPDDIPEDLEFDDDGGWRFDDHPEVFNLEVDDMVQLIPGDSQSFGTRCYVVQDVVPYVEDEFSSRRRSVLIDEA